MAPKSLMQEYKGGLYVEPLPNIATNASLAGEPTVTVANKIKKYGFRTMLDKGYLNVTPHPEAAAIVSEPVATAAGLSFEPTADVAAKIKKFGAATMLKKGYIFSIS